MRAERRGRAEFEKVTSGTRQAGRMHVLLAASLLAAAACDSRSDAEKLGRLEDMQALACHAAGDTTLALRNAIYLDSVAGKPSATPTQLVVDSLRTAYRIDCELATRKVNLFMNGR
jgi:hypothetical protein